MNKYSFIILGIICFVWGLLDVFFLTAVFDIPLIVLLILLVLLSRKLAFAGYYFFNSSVLFIIMSSLINFFGLNTNYEIQSEKAAALAFLYMIAGTISLIYHKS